MQCCYPCLICIYVPEPNGDQQWHIQGSNPWREFLFRVECFRGQNEKLSTRCAANWVNPKHWMYKTQGSITDTWRNVDADDYTMMGVIGGSVDSSQHEGSTPSVSYDFMLITNIINATITAYCL